MIDSPPPRLAAKIEAAQGLGAQFIIIDTPPHAGDAATAAMNAADLILIPCRPSGFDLAAIETTARLVKMFAKPAYVIFNGGSANAPRLYQEAGDAVERFGLAVAPVHIADRAAYRHATGAGKTIFETEPNGKAASEARALHKWVSGLVNKINSEKRRDAA